MTEDIDGRVPASGVTRRYERIADLHEVASLLLDGLDELGLHEAAAYVSLARRRLCDQHPNLRLEINEDAAGASRIDG